MDGSKIFVDSSLVEADASNNSVIDTQSLKHQSEGTIKNWKPAWKSAMKERKRANALTEAAATARSTTGTYRGRTPMLP